MLKKEAEARTLLRRLLRKAEEQVTSQGGASTTKPTSNNGASAVAVSPIRPSPPSGRFTKFDQESKRSTATMIPMQPTQPTPKPSQPTPEPTLTRAEMPTIELPHSEKLLEAEAALEQIRFKTANCANEFSEGKINRAQFMAMYTHFNEQRTVIERMLERDPQSRAWQQVARPGVTGFLRQHYEARLLTYTIYNNSETATEGFIATSGAEAPNTALFEPMLKALALLLRTRISKEPMKTQRRKAENEQWVAIVPGIYTSVLTVFSLEPSQQQIERITDTHRDFERANRLTLERGIRVPEQLVFPHRSLFDVTEA